MTLKKNGQWSLSRLALLATIIGGIAMVVEAMPTAIHYIQTGIAPWATFPAEIAEIKNDTKDIPQMKADIAEIKANVVKPLQPNQNQPLFPSPRQTGYNSTNQSLANYEKTSSN